MIIAKESLGIPAKLVLAYASSSEARRAFFAGELNLCYESVEAYSGAIAPYVEKGDVMLLFQTGLIDEQGKVTNAKIERGVEASLDKESLRVVNELKTWKPGKEKGKAVKVAYTIPINYALDGKSDKKE